MPTEQMSVKTEPCDSSDKSEAQSGRRAGRLVQLHLHQTSRLPHLAGPLSKEAFEGSVAIYGRLKARDAVDSMCCTIIVALWNAIQSSFAEAAVSQDRDQHLARAYEGMALLMEIVAFRENRCALKEDRRREELLKELMGRYLPLSSDPD